jgi:hypothetical protein
MQVWKGWTAAGETPMIKAPSWDEWLTHQLQRVRQAEYHVEYHVRQDVQFSEHELARLMFLRWLHLTGRLDAQERDRI